MLLMILRITKFVMEYAARSTVLTDSRRPLDIAWMSCRTGSVRRTRVPGVVIAHHGTVNERS